MIPLAFATAAAAAAPASSPAIAQPAPAGELRAVADAALIDTLALRAHTFFLSQDVLAGRGTGTPGEHVAAAYLRSQLAGLGLSGGAADGSFTQDVPLVRALVDTAATRLTVAPPGREPVDFATPRDFVVNTGGPSAFRDFAGEAVVVGTPDEALAALDRTVGVELAGRVVVVLGPLGGAATRLVPAWRERGVAGVVLLIPDAERFALYARSRGEARFFVDAALEEPIWQPELPVLLAGPDLSRLLLEGGSASIDADIRVQARSVEAANVLALVPGSDPSLLDEVVVYTAHYDHLGISTPDARGDSIYNGFSDNAAGTAMLLAIARAFLEDPPARSVLFAFFTGEERGLLGSSYFAAHPPFPLGRIAGVINLDAGAPPAPPVTWRIAGGSASPLGPLAAAIAADHGWSASLGDPSPNSDYWGFVARGVPAIFIIPGEQWEGLDDAARDRLRARWDRYHQAGDEWHPDFPFSGLARYARYALEVGRALADAPEG